MKLHKYNFTSKKVQNKYSDKICLFIVKISVSGVRGIYGRDLTLHNIGKFTRLFASSLIKPRVGCVLASDTRPSSRLISEFVAANLMEEGTDVYNLGIAPTPMVFRESRKYA